MIRSISSSKKGQIGSIEMIITFILFIAAFVGVYMVYSYFITDYILVSDTVEQTQAFAQLSDTFFLTQGSPHNWEAYSFAIQLPLYVGIADGGQSISLQKLNSLANNNDTYYDSLKSSFGLFENETEIYYYVEMFNGTELVLNDSLSYGKRLSDFSQKKVGYYFFSHNQDLYRLTLEVAYE